MAFSLFGKRDKPDQQPEPAPPEPQEQKRGFFDRMKQAVTRTRESFSDSISSVIALTREVDETTLTGLEPSLLAADLGAPTTALVIETLRQRAHGLLGTPVRRLGSSGWWGCTAPASGPLRASLPHTWLRRHVPCWSAPRGG